MLQVPVYIYIYIYIYIYLFILFGRTVNHARENKQPYPGEGAMGHYPLKNKLFLGTSWFGCGSNLRPTLARKVCGRYAEGCAEGTTSKSTGGRPIPMSDAGLIICLVTRTCKNTLFKFPQWRKVGGRFAEGMRKVWRWHV